MEYTVAIINDHARDEVEFVRWLGEEGFLDIEGRTCDMCDADLKLEGSTHFKGDGAAMRCSNNHCKRRYSVRTGSFFYPSPLPLRKQLEMLVLFCADATIAATRRVVEVSKPTVINFFDNCRGVWSDELQHRPITFTDPGEYEIDETIIKRVRDEEHNTLVCVWVSGIYSRDTDQCLLYRVADRSAESLIPPILTRVPRHSLTYTDDLTTYLALRRHRFQHYTVNHSAGIYERKVNIGDNAHPDYVSVHINTMEGIFSFLRRRLTYKARRNLQRLDMILKEIMYRNSGRSLFAPFKRFRQ